MPTRQKWGLGFVLLWFVGGGIGHCVRVSQAFFVSIVPPWLPSWLLSPTALVIISGVLELVSATGLLFERVARSSSSSSA